MRCEVFQGKKFATACATIEGKARILLLPLGSPGRRKPPRSDSRVLAVGSLRRAISAGGASNLSSRSDSF